MKNGKNEREVLLLETSNRLLFGSNNKLILRQTSNLDIIFILHWMPFHVLKKQCHNKYLIKTVGSGTCDNFIFSAKLLKKSNLHQYAVVCGTGAMNPICRQLIIHIDVYDQWSQLQFDKASPILSLPYSGLPYEPLDYVPMDITRIKDSTQTKFYLWIAGYSLPIGVGTIINRINLDKLFNDNSTIYRANAIDEYHRTFYPPEVHDDDIQEEPTVSILFMDPTTFLNQFIYKHLFYTISTEQQINPFSIKLKEKVTYINNVCELEQNKNMKFYSFTKSRLYCSMKLNKSTHLLQHAFVSTNPMKSIIDLENPVFYSLFKSDSFPDVNVICIHNLSRIHQTLTDGSLKYFDFDSKLDFSRGTIRRRHLSIKKKLNCGVKRTSFHEKILRGKDELNPKYFMSDSVHYQMNDETKQFSTVFSNYDLVKYDDLPTPISWPYDWKSIVTQSYSTIEVLSNVITNDGVHIDIIMIGTISGYVIFVRYEKGLTPMVYDIHHVCYSSPIKKINKLNYWKMKKILIECKDKIKLVPISGCSRTENCENCRIRLQRRDPYCYYSNDNQCEQIGNLKSMKKHRRIECPRELMSEVSVKEIVSTRIPSTRKFKQNNQFSRDTYHIVLLMSIFTMVGIVLGIVIPTIIIHCKKRKIDALIEEKRSDHSSIQTATSDDVEHSQTKIHEDVELPLPRSTKTPDINETMVAVGSIAINFQFWKFLDRLRSLKTMNVIPDKWMECPAHSTNILCDRFVACKTFLTTSRYRLTPQFQFEYNDMRKWIEKENQKLIMVIDLTNTKRYYESNELVRNGIIYKKLNIRGHGCAPTDEEVRQFISFCNEAPENGVICVHCTHGFNRTGYLIVSYMVEEMDFSVEAAIIQFSKSRHGGIYKQLYIDQLYEKYENDSTTEKIQVTKPNWRLTEFEVYQQQQRQEESEKEENMMNGKRNGKRAINENENRSNHQSTKQFKIDNNLNNTNTSDGNESNRNKNLNSEENQSEEVELYEGAFTKEMMELEPTEKFGYKSDYVQIVGNKSIATRIQKEVMSAMRKLKWNSSNPQIFSGSQPVSMTVDNIELIKRFAYLVTWKADGTRYLLYIDDNEFVYMFDRDNYVYHIDRLTFLSKKSLKRTLLDGELVIDKTENKDVPRFLIYDIIMLNGTIVGDRVFPVRLDIIDAEIISPRAMAFNNRTLDRQKEVFGVRKKLFKDLHGAKEFSSKEFQKELCHETDGLVFQPVNDPYTPGRCLAQLKWKPPELNTVDFLFKIEKGQAAIGKLAKTEYNLYLVQKGVFQKCERLAGTKEELRALHQHNGKIIECSVEDIKSGWRFLRVRTDKSYPNAIETATNVLSSVMNPVNQDYLLSFIDKVMEYRRNLKIQKHHQNKSQYHPQPQPHANHQLIQQPKSFLHQQSDYQPSNTYHPNRSNIHQKTESNPKTNHSRSIADSLPAQRILSKSTD
ncbi:hypothetical protein SNEBB_002338 [Seison nebaliae]|nr:hypothetical protein SNEBB_002338 [Seison nebaliae]